MSQNRISPSAWVYLAIAILGLIDAFAHLPVVVPVTAGLIVLFIVLEFRAIPMPQKIAGVVLFAIGVIAAAQSDNWFDIVVEGIARARIFLLLFFAVSWLLYPVTQSPALQASRETIITQSPGKRYLYLSAGVHVLSSILNLAGLSLLTVMLERHKNMLLKRRLAMALVHGFGSVSCWSPFYIGMVVVLVSMPNLSWWDVGPPGILLAILIMLSGFCFDRMVLRPASPLEAPSTPVPLSRINLWRTVGLLVALVATAMTVVESSNASIPAALGLIGPPFAAIWIARIGGGRTDSRSPALGLAYDVISRLPSFRNEALVFVAANVLGIGVASIIPSGDLSQAVNAVLPWADAKIFALVGLMLFSSMIGLHPVIVVILVTAVLPAESMGLSEWIVGLAFLGSWGMGSSISPFSGTTLFMGRAAGVPSYVIGWHWMLSSVVVNGIVVATAIVAIHHLFA